MTPETNIEENQAVSPETIPLGVASCSASAEVDKEQAGTRAIIKLAKDAGCENDSQVIGFLARQVFDFMAVLTLVGNNLPHIECRTAFTLNQKVQAVLSRQNA